MKSRTSPALESIGNASYVIALHPDRTTATNEKTGEQFIVRHGTEASAVAAVELAKAVGADVQAGSGTDG